MPDPTIPDALDVLREAANAIRTLSSFVTPGTVASAWAKHDAALADVERERKGLRSEVERLKADNARLAVKVKLPDIVEQQLQRDGRVMWNGTLYYRDYEAYCDD